jgi:hypothetical protein
MYRDLQVGHAFQRHEIKPAGETRRTFSRTAIAAETETANQMHQACLTLAAFAKEAI